MTDQDKYKSIYRKLCEQEKNLALFSQDWWLDAVCDQGKWDVCLSFDKSGSVNGALPYYLTKYKGFKVLKMPKLTPFFDLLIKYPYNMTQQNKRYSFENKIMNNLVKQLPKVFFSSQNFSYSFTNWLPFYWQGFKQTTFYSYRFSNLSNIETIYSNLNPSIRNMIKRVEQNLEVVTNDDIELFYNIHEKNFKHQGVKSDLSFSIFKKIDDVSKTRNARKIYFAKDKNNNIHAAMYIVFDQNSAYNLATGLNRDIFQNGAVQFLMWKAIVDCSSRVNCFDFEGSMIPGVESMFRKFGGIQTPYFNVQRSKNKFISILNLIRSKN